MAMAWIRIFPRVAPSTGPEITFLSQMVGNSLIQIVRLAPPSHQVQDLDRLSG